MDDRKDTYYAQAKALWIAAQSIAQATDGTQRSSIYEELCTQNDTSPIQNDQDLFKLIQSLRFIIESCNSVKWTRGVVDSESFRRVLNGTFAIRLSHCQRRRRMPFVTRCDARCATPSRHSARCVFISWAFRPSIVGNSPNSTT